MSERSDQRRKRPRLLTLAMLLWLHVAAVSAAAEGCGASCSPTDPPHRSRPDIVCDDIGCVSQSTLLQGCANTLAGLVVGYVCIVGELPPVFGGNAQTTPDSPLAMSPDLTTNLASVSKTLTAIATVQLLTRNGLTADARIAPFLYSDWSLGLGIDRITFRQLLTHTSGFGQQSNCANAASYGDLETFVAQGIEPVNIRVAQYGNCNFSLLRELIAVLSLGKSALDGMPPNLRAAASSAEYIAYMNRNVLQPAGVSTRQCKPPTNGVDILSYPLPSNNTTSGLDWGDWSLSCGFAGWSLSANDVAKVVRALASGEKLLSRVDARDMFLNCFGWDCAVRPDCPNPYVCKNGGFPNPNPHFSPYPGTGDSNGMLWTYAGILNCRVPVVAVVNSPLPVAYEDGSLGDIIDIVSNAYANAAASGTPSACR